MSEATVISLVNMKGGVGKTTAAVNLAAYWAREHNQKVLLIDLDPQTNASLSLMSEKAWTKWAEDHGTMADVFEVSQRRGGKVPMTDCIVKAVVPEIPLLDLLPSHLQLTFLDLDLAARPGRERIFSRKLEKILGDYDLIVCDCPPICRRPPKMRSTRAISSWCRCSRIFSRRWVSDCCWTGWTI